MPLRSAVKDLIHLTSEMGISINDPIVMQDFPPNIPHSSAIRRWYGYDDQTRKEAVRTVLLDNRRD